jgi:predicted metalloprotease with PDZ domain
MRVETYSLRASLLLAVVLAVEVVAGQAANAGPTLTVLLQPDAPNAQNHVPYLDVSVILDGPNVATGEPLLRMPLVTNNVETVAATIEKLSVSDAKGPLELTFKDDPEGGRSQYRHWVATRATQGQLTVRYRAPISLVLAPRGAAPPLELRSDTGSFSGQGDTFLLLPESQLPWKFAIRWDLSRMGAHAAGVSTFGKGNVAPNNADLQDLKASFFMGGNVHVYPETPPAAGFFAAWYGNAPFDLLKLVRSEQKVYEFYEKFFKRPSSAPYGVFLRENLVNAGGGTSLGESAFVATFGAKTDPDELTITLAHEMLHTFVGGLDSPPGMESSWYSEGLAVYYARLLALRAGQITPAQFLVDLNTTAGRFYTDALIHTPNDQIAPNFWADTRIRVLPYDRGSMYFSVVDGELRAASGGKVKLDDLLLAMLDRRKHGLPLDKADWIALVREHLGRNGEAEFQAMLSGAIMVPEPQGFGPCFTRITKPLRRYQLGFDPKVLVERKRIVRELIPGSAADLAGVRNGDEITKPVPQDIIQGQQDGVLTLELLRDGKPLEISYLPRAETVDAYQWMRTGSLPDSDCGY